jgi:hypothetical protein
MEHKNGRTPPPTFQQYAVYGRLLYSVLKDADEKIPELKKNKNSNIINSKFFN